MFGSTVLEVATGLVFVFLLVSLICSAIGDKISDFLKWRAVESEKGIRDFILGKMQDADLKNLSPQTRRECRSPERLCRTSTIIRSSNRSR